MTTIFFDLETTDLNPVGQILNYAFVEVDDNWTVRSCLRDKIKISRLQLPAPRAILASNTDVTVHNKESVDDEHIAMAKIQKYLANIIEWSDTRLVGFNSNRFDVPYLRTSMIRNGLNPYFGGSVKYGDVLHAVKRLACDRPDFYEKLAKKESGKPSFRLESVAKSLGLLAVDAKQDHESLSDVLLTIKLAQHLAENYGIDVRTYASYEVQKNNFDVVKVFPFVDQNNQPVSDEYCYMAILEQNKTQALWINLKKFEEGQGKASVSWYNKNTSAFFVQKTIRGDDYRKRADVARKELSHINLENFWGEKNCDVEQFIYMMPINQITAVYDAVWRKDLFLIKETKSKFASQLYLRFLSNTADIDQVESQIKDYAAYRYGGRLKIDKENFDTTYQEGVYSESFHSTYNELCAEIEELSKVESNKHLMTQLKTFYDNSVITSLCRDQLKKIVRVRND